MVQVWSAILGVGLIILWIAGLSSPHSTPWMTWMDGIGGIWAFVIAGAIRPRSNAATKAGHPVALAAGLFALWILGLATGVVAWQTWWTFAFACAFVLVAIAGGYIGRQVTRAPVQEIRQDEERFRRRA